jgi:hypothetical protein
VSARFTVADLAASGVLDVGRNRERVAEAAGLPFHETTPERPARASTAAHTKAVTSPAAAARVQTSPSDEAPGLAAHASMPAFPPPSMPDGWLHRLMACDGWSDRKRRLSPEEQLSALVATELRRVTLAGELRCVWTCVRVEHRGGDPIARMIQHLLRVLGVVPGAPDWWFAWATGAGLIELKVERPADLLDLRQDGTARKPTRTYMRPIQRDFRQWAVSLGVRHAVARSVPEVRATLREWERL